MRQDNARIDPDEVWEKGRDSGFYSRWSVYHNRASRRNVNDGGGVIGQARKGRVLLVQSTSCGAAAVTGSMEQWLGKREKERASLAARGYVAVKLAEVS